jgi:hypothetical protein
MVGVRARVKSPVDFGKANNLMRYQSVLGRRLKENVLRNAEHGCYFTAEESELDGEDCLLLSCNYITSSGGQRIWVVPSKGYCIKKVEITSDGKTLEEYTTTLSEYSPGIWWIDSANVLFPRTKSEIHLSLENVSVNEPIDPKVFTLGGTDIPIGTRVIDTIVGVSYIYGEGYRLPEGRVDIALEELDAAQVASTEESANSALKEASGQDTAQAEQAAGTSEAAPPNSYSEQQGGSQFSVGVISIIIFSVVVLLVIVIFKRRQA